jgi:hypothetical protein
VTSLEPNPGMAELGRLADQVRSAGVEVELKVEGSPVTCRRAWTCRRSGSRRKG